MAVGSVSGQGRQMRFALSAMLRSAAYRYHSSVFYRWRLPGACPNGCSSHRSTCARPTRRSRIDIYEGRFVFYGNGVDVDGFSVFDVEPPERRMGAQTSRIRLAKAFARRRHGDLAHPMRAHWSTNGSATPAASTPSPGNRKSWRGASSPGCRKPRLSSTAATIAFYRRFMRSLSGQVRHLRRTALRRTARPPAACRS